MKNLRPLKAATATTKAGLVVLIRLENSLQNKSMATKVTEDFTGREFVITREFDAPRELVFKAWTDPKHLAQWWGPRGFTNPVCEWDVRPGGKIYDVMRAPNGVDYPMGGEFCEIVPPERLVFSC